MKVGGKLKVLFGNVTVAKPTGWRLTVLCVLIITAAMLAVFSVPGRMASTDDAPKIFGLLDHWTYFVPQAFFLDASLHSGEVPLWNPLIFCGTPFAANPQSFMFYPAHFLRSCLTFHPTPFRTHVGLAIVVAIHIVIAGVGTFYFARDHGLSFAASMVAAFVFIFSADFVRRALSNWFMTTAAWLPIVLLLLRRAFSEKDFRRRLPYAVGVGLFFGLSLLAGAPHMSLFMSMTIAFYGMFYRLFSLTRKDFRLRGGLPKTICHDVTVGVLVFVLAALVAGAMLLPAQEFAAYSARGQQDSSGRAVSHEPAWMAKVFASYSGDDNQWRDYRLAGLGATLLACAAFAHKKKRDVFIFTALFWVFLDCSLGPPLPFARFSLWITPFRLNDISRGMIWACFPLGMMAGFGVDAVASRWKPSRWSMIHTAVFAGIGVVMLRILYASVDPHPYLSVSKLVVLVPGLILLVILAAPWLRVVREKAVAGAPESLLAPGVDIRTMLLCILPVLLFTEMFLWNRHYVPYLIEWKGYKGSVTELRVPAEPWNSNYRASDPDPNTFMFKLAPATNGYDPLYLARVHRVLRSPARYDMRLDQSWVTTNNVRGLLFLKRSFWLARQYVPDNLPGVSTLFPSATTVFLNDAPDNMPVPGVERSDLPKRSVSDEVRRIELADSSNVQRFVQPNRSNPARFELRLPVFRCPRVQSSLFVPYTTDCRATIAPSFREQASQYLVRGKTIQIRPTGEREGVLDIPMPDFGQFRITLAVTQDRPDGRLEFKEAYVLCDQQDENALIRIVERRANSVDLVVENLPGHRILTFIDAHYPGWKAYVDNDPVSIHLANDAFKAVVLSPGTHRVRFVFRPWRVYVGLLVSVVTVVAALMFLVAERKRRRRLSAEGAMHETPSVSTQSPGELNREVSKD